MTYESQQTRVFLQQYLVNLLLTSKNIYVKFKVSKVQYITVSIHSVILSVLDMSILHVYPPHHHLPHSTSYTFLLPYFLFLLLLYVLFLLFSFPPPFSSLSPFISSSFFFSFATGAEAPTSTVKRWSH